MTTAAISSGNPEEYYRAFFNNDQSAIEAVKKNCLEKLTAFFNLNVGGMQEIIRVQGEELVLFRTLEAHVRASILNEEIWTSISAKLQAVRQSATAKFKQGNSQS